MSSIIRYLRSKEEGLSPIRVVFYIKEAFDTPLPAIQEILGWSEISGGALDEEGVNALGDRFLPRG